jgi:hypothetical protein
MEKLVETLVKFLPLIFAFSFLVPVIHQAIEYTGIVLPFGLSALHIAIFIGGSWGLFAQIKGRWI